MGHSFTPKTKGKKKKKKKSKIKVGSNSYSGNLPLIKVNLRKLPSQGRVYPKTATISYRPYGMGELKQISESKFSENQMYEIIMRGIFVEDMKKKDITLGDALYLAIYRRVSTMGSNKITIAYKCKGCGKKTEIKKDTKDIDADFIEAPGLPIEFNLNNEIYEFSPMTIRKYFETKDKLIENPEYIDTYAAIAANCSSHEFDDIYNAIYYIHSEADLADLKRVDNFLNHGLKPIINKCSNKTTDEKGKDSVCEYETTVRLDGGQALLLPFRESDGDTRNKISFGKS